MLAIAVDAKSLRTYWDRLAAEDRNEPHVAAAVAQAFITLGSGREAHKIVEEGVERQWDQTLLALYAEGLDADVRQQLERAESWLPKHPRDAVLLLTLGRLCAHQGLWGKARSYFEASLSIEPTHTAHLELGCLLEREGKLAEGAAEYRKALAVTLAQLKQHAGGRRRLVV